MDLLNPSPYRAHNEADVRAARAMVALNDMAVSFSNSLSLSSPYVAAATNCEQGWGRPHVDKILKPFTLFGKAGVGLTTHACQWLATADAVLCASSTRLARSGEPGGVRYECCVGDAPVPEKKKKKKSTALEMCGTSLLPGSGLAVHPVAEIARRLALGFEHDLCASGLALPVAAARRLQIALFECLGMMAVSDITSSIAPVDQTTEACHQHQRTGALVASLVRADGALAALAASHATQDGAKRTQKARGRLEATTDTITRAWVPHVLPRVTRCIGGIHVIAHAAAVGGDGEGSSRTDEYGYSDEFFADLLRFVEGGSGGRASRAQTQPPSHARPVLHGFPLMARYEERPSVADIQGNPAMGQGLQLCCESILAATTTAGKASMRGCASLPGLVFAELVSSTHSKVSSGAFLGDVDASVEVVAMERARGLIRTVSVLGQGWVYLQRFAPGGLRERRQRGSEIALLWSLCRGNDAICTALELLWSVVVAVNTIDSVAGVVATETGTGGAHGSSLAALVRVVVLGADMHKKNKTPGLSRTDRAILKCVAVFADDFLRCAPAQFPRSKVLVGACIDFAQKRLKDTHMKSLLLAWNRQTTIGEDVPGEYPITQRQVAMLHRIRSLSGTAVTQRHTNYGI